MMIQDDPAFQRWAASVVALLIAMIGLAVAAVYLVLT